MCCVPVENDTIYWVDMGLSTISRAKRDQTWREDVVTNGIGRVEGITVDWIAGQDPLHSTLYIHTNTYYTPTHSHTHTHTTHTHTYSTLTHTHIHPC